MGIPITIGIYTPPFTEMLPGGQHLHFRLADLDDPEFLWCESPGEREGSLAVGISLEPVVPEGTEDIQFGAIYLDITLDEVRQLQAQLQRLIDDNPEEGR